MRFSCYADEGSIPKLVNYFKYDRISGRLSYLLHIYTLTNKTKTVLYTGVTNHLKIRLEQHKEAMNPTSFNSLGYN